MIHRPHYFFGAPLRKRDRDAFAQAILRRYDGDIDKAIEYVKDITTRNIAKGSGILSSTSILAGMSYFLGATFALYAGLAAIAITASMLYVDWPKDILYAESKEADYEWSWNIAFHRSIANSVSVFLILCSVILLVIHLSF